MRKRAFGLAAIVAAAFSVGVAAPASAAVCNAPVRYASTSDTIYLGAGSVDTLAEIKAACPSAPLVESSPGVWDLNADLVLQGGATLNVTGGELRLQSLPSGVQRDVSAITAMYGTINLTNTKVTSWTGTGPDTTYAVPSGGTRGRAFIRALSVMEGSTPRTSTMNIVDSDLGFLGFNGAESYGVAYKARGCGLDTPQVCDVLDVLGKQTGSVFHDNYMGTYTWGAKDMLFDGNTYTKNAAYGLDPHDDSDFLTVTNNKFIGNGNHGFICSQRCNDLVIRDNESRNNVGAAGVQVHGIMLHRGVTNTVVENNQVSGNSGGGIAVFDSVGNTIRNNTVDGNLYGLRFSVGSRDTIVTGNKVTNSKSYAVYTYKGSDVPSYTGTSGRPSGIVFTDNVFTGAGAELFKIQDADKLTFKGGSVAGGTKGPVFERALGHTFDKTVTTPKGMVFTLKGTTTQKTSVNFTGFVSSDITVVKDANSTATFDGAAARVATTTPPTSTSVTPTTTATSAPTSSSTASTSVSATP